MQDWDEAGGVPVQPAGEEVATVRVCWPLTGQTAGVNAVYVNELQVTGGGT